MVYGVCVCVVLQEVLDADDTPLRSRRGELMKRDIVQFVPFRELSSKSGANFSLARETLAEIPQQLTSFMKAQNIRPNPPSLRHRQSTVFISTPGGGPPTTSGQPPSGYPGYPTTGPPAGQYPVPAAPGGYPTGPTPYPAAGRPAPYPTGPAPYPTTTAPPPYPF
jgi:hypothetical protein